MSDVTSQLSSLSLSSSLTAALDDGRLGLPSPISLTFATQPPPSVVYQRILRPPPAVTLAFTTAQPCEVLAVKIDEESGADCGESVRLHLATFTVTAISFANGRRTPIPPHQAEWAVLWAGARVGTQWAEPGLLVARPSIVTPLRLDSSGVAVAAAKKLKLMRTSNQLDARLCLLARAAVRLDPSGPWYRLALPGAESNTINVVSHSQYLAAPVGSPSPASPSTSLSGEPTSSAVAIPGTSSSRPLSLSLSASVSPSASPRASPGASPSPSASPPPFEEHPSPWAVGSTLLSEERVIASFSVGIATTQDPHQPAPGTPTGHTASSSSSSQSPPSSSSPSVSHHQHPQARSSYPPATSPNPPSVATSPSAPSSLTPSPSYTVTIDGHATTPQAASMAADLLDDRESAAAALLLVGSLATPVPDIGEARLSGAILQQAGGGPRLRIVVQPPAEAVYNRLLRPAPRICIEGPLGDSPTPQYAVQVTALADDTGQLLPHCVSGVSTAPAAPFVSFSRLKLTHTSIQQRGSAFRLVFRLVPLSTSGSAPTFGSDEQQQSESAVSKWTALPEASSEGIRVFSHTCYLGGKRKRERGAADDRPVS